MSAAKAATPHSGPVVQIAVWHKVEDGLPSVIPHASKTSNVSPVVVSGKPEDGIPSAIFSKPEGGFSSALSRAFEAGDASPHYFASFRRLLGAGEQAIYGSDDFRWNTRSRVGRPISALQGKGRSI